MSTELTNTNDWRKDAEDEAQRLEAKAGLMRLLAMVDDQADEIRITSDLIAAAFHCGIARVARARGRSAPKPPLPVSKLLTRFADSLREKVLAVGELLPKGHRYRLVALAPSVLAALEAQEPDALELVAKFLSAPPDAIAFALVFCIDTIEKRFAS